MSAVSAVAPPMPKKRRRTLVGWFRVLGWRHVVAWIAIAWSVFPILWVISAAFTKNPSISSSALVPTSPTLDNFKTLFNNPDQPYANWYVNTMIVAVVAGFFTVLIAAGAAYAFSRFRFKGRKVGLMFLLLVQMFPAFLALTAIYIIMVNIGDVFPPLGLDTLPGLILVYLGGAMGVNAWLIKGFFDTIPPLAVPVLAVVGLLSFIGTINEFIIASALIQTPSTKTLAVGLQGFIANAYSENWGPFAAGALLAAIPVVILFIVLQKFIVGGLTAGSVKG
jgi:arabinogalactan oligomer/maltooligosaccharide transport system permease protein